MSAFIHFLGCEEGGCGACTVVLTRECPSDSSSIANVSVNSCLRPLCANDGMAITTIEGFQLSEHVTSSTRNLYFFFY